MVVTMDAKVNAPGHNNGVRSIVVVAKAREIANSIQSSLEHQGFRVLVAEPCQAAIDLVLDHPPDNYRYRLSTGGSAIQIRVNDGTRNADPSPPRINIIETQP